MSGLRYGRTSTGASAVSVSCVVATSGLRSSERVKRRDMLQHLQQSLPAAVYWAGILLKSIYTHEYYSLPQIVSNPNSKNNYSRI